MSSRNNQPIAFSDCQTVADYLDLLVWVRLNKPPADAAKEEKDRWLANLKQVEDVLADALSHYGPVLWGGDLWWTRIGPRDNRINRTRVNPQSADQLYWPPVAKAIKAQPLPEKVAGYIDH